MAKRSPQKRSLFDYELAKDVISYNCNTGDFTWTESRGSIKKGCKAGCIDTEGYVRITLNGVYTTGHALAWFLHYGISANGLIDHINTIKNDNRISNLRIASASGNQQNKRIQRNNTSGAKGVWFNKKDRRFIAQGYVKGVKNHIGTYKTIDEARSAYCEWATKQYGEFARFN